MERNNQLSFKWVSVARSLLLNSVKLRLTEFLFIVSSLGCIVLASSQTVNAIPPAPQPNTKPPKIPKPLPPLPEVIPPLENSPAPRLLPPENIPGKITVKKFAIFGNNLISQADIDKILPPYIFHPLSFLELLALPRAIAQLYVDRGYITSDAFIPPQTIGNFASN
jgi:hemolysin activation/secretion protein